MILFNPSVILNLRGKHDISDTLKTRCKSLRLAYVADLYEKIPFENPKQYVTALLEQELELRELARGERNLKKAKFINEKDLETYQWNEYIRSPPQLDQKELESLAFIKQKQNIVLSGSPGTGKTHLATGLGRKTCRYGYEVHFYRVADLMALLEKYWREGRFESFRRKFDKVDMIILDEMGYVPFSKKGAECLFQLISDVLSFTGDSYRLNHALSMRKI